MGSTLVISPDFEAAKIEVISAMLFPRDEQLRTAYKLRQVWSRRIESDAGMTATASEIQALLELPSRRELLDAADKGVKTGTVAGDLLALIYEQSRIGAPEPSMRAAHRRYTAWAVGKKYGTGEALKYSTGQLHRFFDAAAPSVHLWAAWRLLKIITDNGESYRAAFEPDGLLFLLGVARSLQDFAQTFIPKRSKPATPIMSAGVLHRIPDHLTPIELKF